MRRSWTLGSTFSSECSIRWILRIWITKHTKTLLQTLLATTWNTPPWGPTQWCPLACPCRPPCPWPSVHPRRTRPWLISGSLRKSRGFSKIRIKRIACSRAECTYDHCSKLKTTGRWATATAASRTSPPSTTSETRTTSSTYPTIDHWSITITTPY